MALDRIKAPLIKDAVDFDIQLKPYQHFILDNGVEVYSYEGGAEEVMMMDLVFYAGNCYEEKNWVAAATNFLLKNGTHKKTASYECGLSVTDWWPPFAGISREHESWAVMF